MWRTPEECSSATQNLERVKILAWVRGYEGSALASLTILVPKEMDKLLAPIPLVNNRDDLCNEELDRAPMVNNDRCNEELDRAPIVQPNKVDISAHPVAVGTLFNADFPPLNTAAVRPLSTLPKKYQFDRNSHILEAGRGQFA